MRGILTTFIEFIKLKKIPYILITYGGKILSDYKKENFLNANFNLNSFLKSDNLKKNRFYIDSYNGFWFFNIPNYEKLVIFFKSSTNPDSLMDIYLISELIDSVDSSVCFLDGNYKIILSNQNFNIKFSETYLGKITYFSEFILPEYLERVIGSLKSRTRQELHVEMYDINGNTLSVKLNIFPFEEYSIVIITDLKEKEIWAKEIEGLKRIQNLVFDAIAQGIIVLDKEGNIIKFNKFTTEKYKFNNSEMIGKNIFHLFPDFLNYNLDKVLAEIIATKKTKKILNLKRYSNRLKKELVQNLYGYPLIENGRCVGVVVLIEDITEKKILEDEFNLFQKKNEIVNELNKLFSTDIEKSSLILNVLKYLHKNLNSDALYYIDSNTNNTFKFDPKNQILKKGQIGLTEYFKKLDDQNILYLTNKEIKDLILKKRIKSVVYIPISNSGKIYGKVVIEFTREIKNDRIKKDFIETFFKSAGNIFEKSYINEEKNETLKKLETILKVSKMLSLDKDYYKGFKKLTKLLMDEVKADRGFILVRTDEEKLRAVSAVGIDQKELMEKEFEFGKGISGTVAKTKEPLLLKNVLDFPYLEYTKGFRKKEQSAICVPIIYRDELVGILMLTRFGRLPFEEKDFEFVKIIANNTSSFVKSLILQMDSDNKIEQLTLLYKIFISLRNSLNISFISKIVTTTLGSLLKSKATLLLEKIDGGYVLKEFYFENENTKENLLKKNIYRFPHEIDKGLVSHFRNSYELSREFFKNPYRYLTVLPIFLNEKDQFLILVFTDNDLKTKIYDYTFNAIIQEIYIKFENALLFEENERKLKQYNIISDLTEKLIYIKDIDEYFNSLLKSAIDIVDGTYATLMLEENEKLKFKASIGVDIEILEKIKDLSKTVAENVFKTGSPIIINNTQNDPNFKPIESLNKIYKIKNTINVPLKFLGKTIGVLAVDNKKSGQFSEFDEQFLKTLSNSAIIALSRFQGSIKDLQISDLILNNIPSGVAYIDRFGRIIHYNNSFLKIGDFTKEDVYGKMYEEVFKDHNQLIKNIINDQKPVFRDEIYLINKKRGEIPCGISITPIKYQEDLELVCIIQDLSEIKKIQNELKAKENLALLGQMAAGMAHEIKNPLSGILTGMEFLKMKLKNDPIVVESLDLVIKEVKRLDRLVNDMTSFAKAKTILLTQVNIFNVVEHSMEMIKNRFEENNIKFEINIDKDLPSVLLDEEQMIEVFINILINAIQSIGKNGLIKISVGKEEEYMVIDIFNDGPKIPEENLSKIFTPFFTTKSGGTGLGLAISYNIIKEHNGLIKAVNRENGVSFVIKLPIRK